MSDLTAKSIGIIPPFFSKFFILIVCFASVALADDFKTIDGREHKNANVSRVEPDGIVVTFSGGIVKIPFTELSPEIQKKYGYDPQAAAAYSAEQTANQEALYKQQQESERQRSEERGKVLERERQSVAVDLDAPAEKKLTIRSEVRRGLDAAINLVGFGSALVMVEDERRVSTANVQRNTDTDAFKLGFNAGMYLRMNTHLSQTSGAEEASLAASAINLYALQAAKAQSSLGLTDEEVALLIGSDLSARIKETVARNR